MLAFTEVLADREAHGKYALALYDTGRYMRLDSAAQRALNVLRSRTDANDNFSLYGLLNRTRTAMGKRLLKARSRQGFTAQPLGFRHRALGPVATSACMACSTAHAHGDGQAPAQGARKP